MTEEDRRGRKEHARVQLQACAYVHSNSAFTKNNEERPTHAREGTKKGQGTREYVCGISMHTTLSAFEGTDIQPIRGGSQSRAIEVIPHGG